MKEISRGELHLYPAAREELETNLDRFYAALVPAEKKQAKRLIIPEKKEQFILGRGFLRSLLAAYTGFNPGNWRYPATKTENLSWLIPDRVQPFSFP